MIIHPLAADDTRRLDCLLDAREIRQLSAGLSSEHFAICLQDALQQSRWDDAERYAEFVKVRSHHKRIDMLADCILIRLSGK